MTIAVTFDFHDTLATCDRWFETEVYTLVVDILGWCDASAGTSLAVQHRSKALQAYRDLRMSVIECGLEIDAVGCAESVLKHLGIELRSTLLTQAIDAIMLSHLDDASPVLGAVESARSLAERGVKVGVVSSAVHHQYLVWTLERFGLLNHVAAITTSAQCGYYKTRREIYDRSIGVLGVSPENCVHIGDSYEYDVLTANRAGLRTIWFRRASTIESSLAADATVETLVNVDSVALDVLGQSR